MVASADVGQPCIDRPVCLTAEAILHCVDSGEFRRGCRIIVAIMSSTPIMNALTGLTDEQCEVARRSRDPRFDGRFIVAVVTTGIYCRPVCPAPIAAQRNVRYYPSPAAAQDAGFRPCLRCRPELAPRMPEWCVPDEALGRALRLVDAGYLDQASVEDLAARVGLSARHLSRLFGAHLGTTPGNLARTRRVQLAKRLLDDTDLSMTAVAMHAGFGSLRRFNDQIVAAYGATPSQLRKGRRGRSDVCLTLNLPTAIPTTRVGCSSFLPSVRSPGWKRSAWMVRACVTGGACLKAGWRWPGNSTP